VSGVPVEVVAVWLLFAAVTVGILVTYARLPAAQLYHVSGTGGEGGASRALVFLNFPFALVAIALLTLLYERLPDGLLRGVAGCAAVLCLAVVWPGVVDQRDLDAKPVNAIAAAGILLTLGLTLVVGRGGVTGPARGARPSRVSARRPPRPPPRHGRRASRPDRAPALARRPGAAGSSAPDRARRLPRADGLLRAREHRERLLDRAGVEARLDGVARPGRAAAARVRCVGRHPRGGAAAPRGRALTPTHSLQASVYIPIAW
jgi:hypothetical protein